MTDQIIIKLKNKDILVTFDKCGNLYFSPHDNPSNLFDLNITSNNSLVCDKYNNNNNNASETVLEENKIIQGELKPFYNNVTLRGEIIKNKSLEGEKNSYDSDDETKKESYFQEDYEYNQYLDNNNEDSETEPFFSFNGTIKTDLLNKIVFNREEEILALYDTLIYKGDPSCANIIFKTSLISDTPIYRICIYTSGDIKFRPIGQSDKFYELQYSSLDDTISLIHKSTETIFSSNDLVKSLN